METRPYRDCSNGAERFFTFVQNDIVGADAHISPRTSNARPYNSCASGIKILRFAEYKEA